MEVEPGDKVTERRWHCLAGQTLQPCESSLQTCGCHAFQTPQTRSRSAQSMTTSPRVTQTAPINTHLHSQTALPHWLPQALVAVYQLLLALLTDLSTVSTNENRKKRKRLRWQAANHGCHCFDQAFLLAGACVCCVNCQRKRLRFLRFSFTQAIAFEWKPGFTQDNCRICQQNTQQYNISALFSHLFSLSYSFSLVH